MNYEDVLKKIKSKGYWRISFEPLAYDKQKLSITQCKELIEKNAVHLRGWDYPHIPGRLGDDTALEVGDNYWQGWLDWEGENHKEFWRIYQSTQFIHYLGLREDWLNDFQINSMWERDVQTYKSGQALGVVGTTYQITEIFEFLARLMRDELYKEGVKVNISLNNTEGRKLIMDQYARFGFTTPKQTSSKILTFEKKYSYEEIVNESRDKALEVLVHFYERFNWLPPNVEVIKSDQEKFLDGKI